MNKAVTLYDTTLRDGTQGTGISFSVTDKLRVARKLDAFGIDYIEGGWPGSNPRDEQFFAEAAKESWQHARLTAFGMTRRGNIRVEDDAQVRKLLDANTPCVCIVGKTWPLHVTEVFKVSLEENLAMIADTVRFLKSHGREVLYDAEHFFDSFREDPDYSLATIAAAKSAGADLIVLCETNGGAMPEFVHDVTARAVAHLGTGVGIHTHNDGGVGVANALAAVRAGAIQVQGTINGYGERVGNCNLITVAANLQLKYGITVAPDLTKLRELSLFVDELANVAPDIRAPYVGKAAFTHKGGLHVHAVQKLARTYEHVAPALVGNEQLIVISDMSGQSNILSRAESLGIPLDKGSPAAAAILSDVKALENEGYEFEAAGASFELLIRRHLGSWSPLFETLEYECTYRRDHSRQYESCVATAKVKIGDQIVFTAAEGDGPVNALDAALRKALAPHFPQIDSMRLSDYKVRIIDGHEGTAAKTRVLIDSTSGEDTWSTVGVSFNIIDASWRALADSIAYHLLSHPA
ncbi:MAG: 2-isopropylmalate synthase [Verrucomicrobia bacterium]|jgi:2-isopropylmalate synthase|nr:MAG: 2-isopropylmalate synthase [Verrucomicrobiota bacterium]